ncbi:hypothetical protein F5Y06DRAFT_303320 [Hypoxylon sp. FL0890]|nr:hypothetical protein F5Y06DRAFT_303320 [Hypoxylon sp. FL0890]
MLFKHILSAAAVSAICQVASASRCKPRTSSSGPASTVSSYSSIPSSTYAVSVTTSSSYIIPTMSSAASPFTTSSVAVSSTTSEISSSSSTDSLPTASGTSSSEISSTVSQTSSTDVSSTASAPVTESSSSTSSVETSSSTTSSETSSSSSAAPTPTQLVVNPGFEITDPLTWTYSGYQLNMAASGSSDADAYSGSRCFIAQGNPGLWQIALKQTVPVVIGQSYLFQYALKMDPPANCVMDILINNVRTRRPELNANSGSWVAYTDSWTATSDSAAIMFSSQCYNGGPMNKLYYDDVTLTTVAAPQVSD